jgi:hypothetical protein
LCTSIQFFGDFCARIGVLWNIFEPADAAPASPSGPPVPPEALRFPTHAHTPRCLDVSATSHAAPAGPSRATLLRARRPRLAPYRGVNGWAALAAKHCLPGALACLIRSRCFVLCAPARSRHRPNSPAPTPPGWATVPAHSPAAQPPNALARSRGSSEDRVRPRRPPSLAGRRVATASAAGYCPTPPPRPPRPQLRAQSTPRWLPNPSPHLPRPIPVPDHRNFGQRRRPPWLGATLQGVESFQGPQRKTSTSIVYPFCRIL